MILFISQPKKPLKIYSRKMSRSMGSYQSDRRNNDEWLTPPEIVHSLGKFDLDPCSPIFQFPFVCAIVPPFRLLIDYHVKYG